ncbi:unnamed protein product [Callosobruchus maculatus]|uniref:Uncharacterized protein n=1 Tax=Callosobruchus maculatus TaxID=64391 RepID=A0A653CNT0_CALMS|nr:unnamed protein product [Callosobruchus maculatus]
MSGVCSSALNILYFVMDDVRSLLVQLGLGHLISRFEEHKINN